MKGGKTMNMAFAGFRHSHIFGLYNSAINNPDVNIVLCYEEDEVAKKEVSSQYNTHFNCNSYDEILKSEKVDAVAIGDYYGIRGQRIIDALKAGKHVICDKPLCTDLKELEIIESLAREKNLKVFCLLDMRYSPQVIKTRKLIKEGIIGDVVNVSFTGQHCLDYGVRPMWYFEEGKHGGTINDIAIHGIDVIRFVTRKNLSKVNCARTWNAFAQKEKHFKDCGQFMVEMENISVMADVSYAAPKFNGVLPTYWEFCFWGTDGLLKFNLETNNVYVYKTELETYPCEKSDIEHIRDFMLEINGTKTQMDTFDMLKSQRQVLEIQLKAK